MLAPSECAPHRLSPLPLDPCLTEDLGPVVMADDPCEAAFGSADPTGPRKYHRARYYSPKIGRFISEDPIRWAGGLNLYAYVENDPVNRNDPSGLQSCCQNGGDCGYWFCYERCVNKFLLDPVTFGAGMVTAAAANTAANAPSGVRDLTNAQFSSGVMTAWAGAKLGCVKTIEQVWRASKMGQAAGGAAGALASGAAAAAATAGAGVVLGCTTACLIDACSY